MTEKYYGQHGEDFLLNRIFQGKSSGYYVEIGCLDGIEFSNTYFFEKKGWKGLCIEAHNDFITQLKKNRPAATIVHCAVGEKDLEEVTFYANKLGSLSTLDKSEELRWQQDHYKEFFHGFVEQKVPMKTLNTIFSDTGVKEIDFISLDIEGYEIHALSGLDLSKYRPRIFIIEYKDDIHKAGLEAILLKAGYFFHAKIGCNLFYGTRKEDKKVFTTSHNSINLVSFDAEGKEKINLYKIQRNTLVKKVKNRLSILKNSITKK